MPVSRLKHYNEEGIQYLKEVANLNCSLSAGISQVLLIGVAKSGSSSVRKCSLLSHVGTKDAAQVMAVAGVTANSCPPNAQRPEWSEASWLHGCLCDLGEWGLSFPIWKIDLKTVVRIERENSQSSGCNR